MKIVEMHTHSDTCSGLYIMEDGTRVHWSEGRSSEIDVIHPDGRHTRHPVSKPHPIVTHIAAAEERGDTGEWRNMTPVEEAYHDAIRSMPKSCMQSVSL